MAPLGTNRWRRQTGGWLALAVVSIVLISCQTMPPLEPADLSAPGWRVRQGQGVWKPSSARLELAGEIILATRDDGDYFVQFSKTPLTLAVAQKQGPRWRIDFGQGQRHWSGIGTPPGRFCWFELPLAMSAPAKPLDHGWKLVPRDDGNWLLENSQTGERIEGFLSP